MISKILEQLVKLKTPTRSRDFGVLSANKKKIVVNEVSPNLIPPPFLGLVHEKGKKTLTSNLLRNFYLEDNLKVFFFFLQLWEDVCQRVPYCIYRAKISEIFRGRKLGDSCH